MIEIKYEIFDEMRFDPTDILNGRYGYFIIQMNQHWYGDFRSDMQLTILSIDIEFDFENYLKAMLLLKTTATVYVKAIETVCIWYELHLTQDHQLEMSEVEGKRHDNFYFVVKDTQITVREKHWTEIGEFSVFLKLLVTQANKYLEELKIINTLPNKTIDQLEGLVRQVEESWGLRADKQKDLNMYD